MTATVTQTERGLVIDDGSTHRLAAGASIDAVFTSNDPLAYVDELFGEGAEVGAPPMDAVLAPIGSQEVWAAGVTYLRSRDARSSDATSVYDHVYDADRPELFFKATPSRVVGTGRAVHVRADSVWNAPEPELTLAINAAGRVFGYTIGNDVSSRTIEAENPLYLPQAKVYDRSAALGPVLVVSASLPEPSVGIRMMITRSGEELFSGATTVSQIKRPLQGLADWLFAENVFPNGAYLMTGTGIVPPQSCDLVVGDVVSIEIDGIGTLTNHVD